MPNSMKHGIYNRVVLRLLKFAHPEIRPNLSHDGLPIVSSAPFTQHVHDQLNNRWEFTTVADHLRTSAPTTQHVPSGGVLNMVLIWAIVGEYSLEASEKYIQKGKYF